VRGDRSLVWRGMTAEEVLDFFVADHRLQAGWDPEADPDAVLTFETTVAEWREACDLLAWRALGRAANKQFQVDFDDKEWRRVLTPPGRRTLRDVCELIASRAIARRPQPVTVLGRRCGEAGAFFGVLRLLRDAGVPTAGIRPSTPIAEYTRRHENVFMEDIRRLAPGYLLRFKKCHPVGICSCLTFALGSLMIMLGGCIGAAATANWGGCFVLLGLAGLILSTRILPRAVTLEGLDTFGDVARAVWHSRR